MSFHILRPSQAKIKVLRKVAEWKAKKQREELQRKLEKKKAQSERRIPTTFIGQPIRKKQAVKPKPRSFPEEQEILDKKLLSTVYKKRIGEVRRLLDEGANPDAYAKDEIEVNRNGRKIRFTMVGTPTQGASALARAIIDNNTAIIELLIEKGADVNKGSGVYLWTPLMFAAQYDNVKTAELLINKGADVNLKGSFGNKTTPLGVALDNNNTNVAEVLRKHGAVEE